MYFVVMPTGFVGSGMLSGAIAGSVFTSPPPSSILAAIRKVGLGNSGKISLQFPCTYRGYDTTHIISCNRFNPIYD